MNIEQQDSYTKNIGIWGFPGAGKTWCMMYLVVYAISKGLTVITTAIMSKRSIELGGIHIHQLFLLPTETNLTAHRRSELAILKLLKNPKKLDLIKSLDIIFLMKWVNCQQSLYLFFISFYAKQETATFFFVEF